MGLNKFRLLGFSAFCLLAVIIFFGIFTKTKTDQYVIFSENSKYNFVGAFFVSPLFESEQYGNYYFKDSGSRIILSPKDDFSVGQNSPYFAPFKIFFDEEQIRVEIFVDIFWSKNEPKAVVVAYVKGPIDQSNRAYENLKKSLNPKSLKTRDLEHFRLASEGMMLSVSEI